MISYFVRSSLVAAAFAASVAAAQAADIRMPVPNYAPPPAVMPCMACSSWTGMYIGINGGYGFGDADYDFRPGGSGAGALNLFANNATGGRFSQKHNGAAIGGHLGFNQQWGGVVAGLEASLDWAGIKKATANPFAITPGSATYETNVRWFGALTPRLGYAMGSFLVYGKGGLAFANIESRLSTTALGGRRFNERNDHLGWNVGGGAEWAVMSSWILGVEYDYFSFAERRYGGAVSPTTGAAVDYTVKPAFSTVMARASYKFSN
jgi:outer membrane immunogenic protein